jgi:hypothetical protein
MVILLLLIYWFSILLLLFDFCWFFDFDLFILILYVTDLLIASCIKNVRTKNVSLHQTSLLIDLLLIYWFWFSVCYNSIHWFSVLDFRFSDSGFGFDLLRCCFQFSVMIFR